MTKGSKDGQVLPAPADYDLFLVLNAFEIDSQRQRGIPLHTYAQVFEHRHLLPLVVERPTANQLLGSLQDVTFPRTVRVRSEDLAGSRIPRSGMLASTAS